MKTIKLGLFISFTVIYSIGMNAQKFHYGTKLGANFTVQSEVGDLYDNDDIKTGIHAGVYSKMNVSDKFDLQLEANYDQKGSSSKNLTNTYDYLTVPLLARYSLGKSWKTPLSFNVYVGPYAGFLLKASRKYDDDETKQTTNVEENTNNVEWGVNGGFVITYPLKNNNIFLDFRLGLGLNQFDKTNDEPRNKYFGIILGFEF